VRDVVSLCSKIIKAGPTRRKTRVELVDLSLGDERELERMKMDIAQALVTYRWAAIIELVFI
jgi:hypothetical protein